MGIERLNKAAMAAGYAMATPEDYDTGVEQVAAVANEDVARAIMPAGKSLVLAQPAPTSSTISAALAWARSCVPSFGGRATA